MSDPPRLRPRVSAIVAVYNEERRLAQCLESLVDQSYRPLEIIVVDDGSSDGTRDVAARFPAVRLLTQEHLGKARAVNLGAAGATGEVLLFLDGDMYFDPGYVEALVTPIIAGTELGTCHGQELVANAAGTWSRCWQAKAGLPPGERMRLTPRELAEGSIIFRAVRTEAFRQVGGFDDTGHTDDHTLYPKLGRRARFVPEATCYHYNVEDLREVFSQGVWGGKSIYFRYGAKALLHYFPPWSMIRACGTALRLRLAAIAVYDLVFETGIFWGVLRRALGVDATYAR